MKPDSPAPQILVHRTHGVEVLTLNRPRSANAVTLDAGELITRHLQAAAADPQVAAVVLASTGKVFCAGYDLKAPPADTSDPAGQRSRIWQGVFLAMVDFPKPFVVAVNGAAIGLGCMFVMLADHVVCVPDAYISLPEIKHGMLTPAGYTITKFGLNHSIAADMTLAARTVTLASVAHLKRIEVVASTAVLERALSVASELAAHPAHAYRMNKSWVNHQLRAQINEAFAAGASFRREAATGISSDPMHDGDVKSSA